MVIGSGLIAKAFDKYSNENDVVIFASGVSNSKEDNPRVYQREEDLLSSTIAKYPGRYIVYFSTCSLYDISINKSLYVKHKISMEKIVQDNCEKFYIFRLPQVVGITTSPTFVNFIFSSIQNGNLIKINEYSTRNLIHIDEVYTIISYLIDNKIYNEEVTNIATPYNIMVLDIVLEIEKIMHLKAKYQLIEFGNKQDIDISKIKLLNNNWKIFDNGYLYNILYKYYRDTHKKFK